MFLCPSLYILLPIDNKNDDMVILLQQTSMVKDNREVMKSGHEAFHQQMSTIVEGFGSLRDEVKTLKPPSRSHRVLTLLSLILLSLTPVSRSCHA